MNNQPVIRDERTVAVENASYRLAYTVMSFGLLLIVAVRGLVLKESSWDLLALVIVGGCVATFYQGAHHIITRRTILMLAAVGLISAVVAMVIVLLT